MMPRQRLTAQTSIRFSDSQRAYLKEQLRRVRLDPTTGALPWSEADVIRAIIENADKTGFDLAAAINGAL